MSRSLAHDGQEHKRSTQGPDTDAQDQPPPFTQIRLATHGRSIQMGSKTEIGPRNPDFRSSLNSRHSPTRRSRPKSAISGSHVSFDHSSARSRERSLYLSSPLIFSAAQVLPLLRVSRLAVAVSTMLGSSLTSNFGDLRRFHFVIYLDTPVPQFVLSDLFGKAMRFRHDLSAREQRRANRNVPLRMRTEPASVGDYFGSGCLDFCGSAPLAFGRSQIVKVLAHSAIQQSSY